MAHEDNHRYGNILNATTAIVFFGTPHRGASGTTDIGLLVGKVINVCLSMSKSGGLTGNTRTDLLDTLSADSNALKDLATSFRSRLRNLEIVTCYETEITPPLKQPVRILSISRCKASIQDPSNIYLAPFRSLADSLLLWIFQKKKLFRFMQIT
jgi:hypothetical protein